MHGDRQCSTTMYPYHDRQGEITHAVVVTTDITEQKRTEEKLAQQSLILILDHRQCVLENREHLALQLCPSFLLLHRIRLHR